MISIAMVGDIFLQEPLPRGPALKEVVDLLRSADIAFGNLETPASTRGQATDKWVNMRMHPDLLSDVTDMGFDVLTLANNHMMDFGETAFVDTLTHLQQRDIACVGAGMNLDQAWEARVLTAGPVNVAFLGAASTLGPASAAGPNRPGVAPIHIAESYSIDPSASLEQPGSAPYVFTQAWQEDLERATDAVKRARNKADLIVIAMHWGVPPFWRSRFQDGLADYQIEVGHALIDAGADLIVGHHPHSLQAIEIYRGKPIFYSLGNFVFHHNQRPMSDSPISRSAPYSMSTTRRDRNWSETIIAIATLNADGHLHYHLHPVLLDDAGNPTLLKGEEARALIARLDAMSPKAAITYVDGHGHLSVG